MAHACCGCTAANYAGFNNRHTQSFARALRRARSSDDAGADNDRVVSFGSHLRMPIEKGSRSSMIRSDSAVMKADPLRARACTTRGSIVGNAGTEDEILTVHSGELRWTKQFDVIDLLTCAS